MGDFPYLEYLSRLYHDKGKETGNWWDFLKANGLANSCVVRDDSCDRSRLLYDIETDWYSGSHPLTFSEHQELTNEHKHLLHSYRDVTRNDLYSLKDQQEALDTFDIFSEANLNAAYKFAENVFKKSLVCTDGFVKFSEQIMKSSVDILNRSELVPPCPFAVVGLGSVARGEATPYSDLEYVFLVESDTNIDYFMKLAVDSYFRIGNIGETPLKSYNIEEISLESESKGSTFSDTVLGYRFDGICPQAGNIPTGNPGHQCLIQTVDAMLDLYKGALLSAPGELTGDLSDLLSTSVLIYSYQNGKELHKEFLKKRQTYEETEVNSYNEVTKKRLHTLSKDLESYNFLPTYKFFGPPENFDIKVKTHIFRFPTLLANNLSIALALNSRYAWDIFALLHQEGFLSHENCRYLQILLALSLFTRTSAYLVLKTKSEKISLYTYNLSEERKKHRYHVPANIFTLLGCLLIPIKVTIDESVQQLIASASTITTNFNIVEVLRSILSGLQIIKSDFLLKVEVLHFAGDSSSALEQLYYTVGKQNVNKDCDRFLQIIHEKYKAQRRYVSNDDKRLSEICCYLLLSERKYGAALVYLNWLIDHETCNVCKIRWKVLKGDCLNHLLGYVDAYKVLKDVFLDLRKYLAVEEQHTLYATLKNKLETLDDKVDTDVLFFEVVSHAYKTIANTCRHLKFFGFANEYINVSLTTCKPLLNKFENSKRFEISLIDLMGTVHAERGEYVKSLQCHYKSLDKLEAMHGISTNHPDVASVFSNIGKVHRKRGEYKKSLEFYHKALKMRKAIFVKDPFHPDIAECLMEIGNVHLDTRDFKKALQFQNECLNMRRKHHCDDLIHPNIAVSYYNLGLIYRKQGQYDKSLKEFNSALHFVKSSITFINETKHPDIAEYYREMANVYSDLGKYQKSLEFRQQSEEMVIAIYNDVDPFKSRFFNDLVNVTHHGDRHIHRIQSCNEALDKSKLEHGENTNHSDIAEGYSSIGILYQDLGEYSKSHAYFSKSLDIWKALYGEHTNHPYIASSYKNLGDVYGSMCEYQKSLGYYNKSLQMRKCVYGKASNNPEIATSYNSIGKGFMRIGRYRKSLELYKRGLDMRKVVYGENMNHPEIADSYHNIAILYNEMGEYNGAIEFHTRSLSMRKAIYGEAGNHSEIAKSYIYMSDVYLRRGQINLTLEYSKLALVVAKNVYGENSNHPIIGCSCVFMANAYRRKSQYTAALEFCEKALNMADVVYGADSKHHDKARIYNNYGNIYEDMGMHSKALEYYTKGLKHKQLIYGEETNHPDFCITYMNIGFSNYKLNEYFTAFQYYTKALDIWRSIYGDGSSHLYLAVGYNYVGLGHSSMGEFAKSLEYHTRSLNMMNVTFGEDGHPEKAKNFTKTAIMYIRQGEYTMSLEYLFRSLVMLEEVYEGDTDNNLVASNYRHIGNTYRHLVQYEESLEYLNLSLNMLQSIYGEDANQCDIAEVYCHLGRTFSIMGKYPESLQYHLLSLKMREALQHKVYISQSYRALGKLYHRTKQYNYAQYCYSMAIPVSAHYPILESVQTYTNIAESLMQMAEYKRAAQFLRRALNRYPRYDCKLIAFILYLLGRCCLQQREFSNSWSYLYSALNFYQFLPKHDKFRFVQAQIHLSISHLLLHLRDLPHSFEHAQEALQLTNILVGDKAITTPKFVELNRQAVCLNDTFHLIAH